MLRVVEYPNIKTQTSARRKLIFIAILLKKLEQSPKDYNQHSKIFEYNVEMNGKTYLFTKHAQHRLIKRFNFKKTNIRSEFNEIINKFKKVKNPSKRSHNKYNEKCDYYSYQGITLAVLPRARAIVTAF